MDLIWNNKITAQPQQHAPAQYKVVKQDDHGNDSFHIQTVRFVARGYM